MKNQWLVYVIVAIVSVGAGFAIAGPPDNQSTPPTISRPETTLRPTTTVAEETTAVPSTDAPDDEPADSTTTTAAARTTTTTTEPASDAAEIAVVVVNGAGTQGLASEVRDQLLFVGFAGARATDGTTLVDDTAVYFYEGFEREAEVIAAFLEIDPELIRPVAEAPEFTQEDGDQVAVYLGRDRS